MKTLKQQQKELKKKLNEIESKIEAEKNKVKTIKIGNYEYETKDKDFNLTFEEASKLCPKGWELWTHQDCIDLWNNEENRDKLNLNDCWFFIINPFKNSGVAGFSADSDGANFYCDWSPDDPGSYLGVRFKRKIKCEAKNCGRLISLDGRGRFEIDGKEVCEDCWTRWKIGGENVI